jgi:HK97 family phage portal protein
MHIVTKARVRVKAGRSEVEKGIGNEGEWRPGPYYLPITGGWLPAEVGSQWNWWQNGYSLQSFQPSAMVEACVSAYAQTVAMCPGDHWRMESTAKGRERVTNSALARFLKKPNWYQSISDFLLNGVRSLYAQGNWYAVALRNNRFEIESLHIMNPFSSFPQIAYNGEIFYNLSGNPVIEHMFDAYDSTIYVPARDVLHIKLNTSPYNPLVGESPIIAAARDIAVNDVMAAQQLQFYLNQAKPGIILSTDQVLSKDQVDHLRERWNEQTKKLGAGGTPILTAGLKPQVIGINQNDSQLVQSMKISDQHIALAFRVPMQILGIGGSGPSNTTEALMQSWLASSLGFCLNHVEENFGRTFQLGGYPDDYLEFDTSALLRSAFKDRVAAFAQGVQGGIFEPDYARADFGLPKVKGGYGEEPRVQSQVVPLSAAGAIPAAPSSPVQPAAPAAPAKDISDDDRDRFRSRFRLSHDRQFRVIGPAS